MTISISSIEHPYSKVKEKKDKPLHILSKWEVLFDETESQDSLISIIICAFSLQRAHMTVDCINSVLNNNYKFFEIIVVVDGNKELKQKMESEFKGITKVLIIGDLKDEGPSIARNRGIGFAKGKIIAFIDDDAYAPVDWLERISKNFVDYPDIMAMGGKLLPVYENGSQKLPDELLWIIGCTYKGHPENSQFVRNVISANMAVKKDVFKEINFEITFHRKNRILFFPIKQLEDTLFGIRLNNKKSDAILYDPETIVFHNVPKERLTLNYIIKRTFSEGIGKAKLGHIIGQNVVKNEMFLQEQNYSKILFISTIKYFFTFRIKNSFLLSLAALSVIVGYISECILNIHDDTKYYGK